LKHIDAEISLIAGSGGIFNVSADGKEIFSKKIAGHFPKPVEILDKLK